MAHVIKGTDVLICMIPTLPTVTLAKICENEKEKDRETESATKEGTEKGRCAVITKEDIVLEENLVPTSIRLIFPILHLPASMTAEAEIETLNEIKRCVAITYVDNAGEVVAAPSRMPPSLAHQPNLAFFLLPFYRYLHQPMRPHHPPPLLLRISEQCLRCVETISIEKVAHAGQSVPISTSVWKRRAVARTPAPQSGQEGTGKAPPMNSNYKLKTES